MTYPLVLDLAAAHDLPLPQDGDLVAVAGDLAKLVGDDEHAELIAVHHLAHHAQHFIRFLRRKHGSGFIEYEKTLAQIKLLQYFDRRMD